MRGKVGGLIVNIGFNLSLVLTSFASVLTRAHHAFPASEFLGFLFLHLGGGLGKEGERPQGHKVGF